ncbi:hypothetical protein LINPERHAP1_LOCUS26862 [Linum perenne]
MLLLIKKKDGEEAKTKRTEELENLNEDLEKAITAKDNELVVRPNGHLYHMCGYCVSNFDKNNWWYLKTTHPDGGLTMLVFYDGNHFRISHDNFMSESDSIIPLPFSKDLEVYSYVHTFSIFRLNPFGVKFGFAYRPK